MKKIFALVLALTLVLTAMSAMAANSPTSADISNTTVTGVTGAVAATQPALTSELLPDNDATTALKNAMAAAEDKLEVVPALKEAADDTYTEINEICTVKLSGDATGINSLTVNYVFPTKYEPAGAKVIVAFGIPDNSGEIAEWLFVDGTIQEDGSINVTLDKDQIAKLLNKEVTIIVLSAKPEA